MLRVIFHNCYQRSIISGGKRRSWTTRSCRSFSITSGHCSDHLYLYSISTSRECTSRASSRRSARDRMRPHAVQLTSLHLEQTLFLSGWWCERYRQMAPWKTYKEMMHEGNYGAFSRPYLPQSFFGSITLNYLVKCFSSRS